MSQIIEEAPIEQNSILHRLAPELRNDIFACLLQGPDRIDLIQHQQGWQNKTQDMARPLALSRTCKQFHKEFTARFYATNTFHLSSVSNYQVFHIAKSFLTMIGPTNADALQGLVLTRAPLGCDMYRGGDYACDALREIFRERKNPEKAELLSLKASVHTQLRYRLCTCWQVTSTVYTMHLDFKDLVASLQDELKKLVQTSAFLAQKRIAAPGDYNLRHQEYLLKCMIFGIREVLAEEDGLEGAGVTV